MLVGRNVYFYGMAVAADMRHNMNWRNSLGPFHIQNKMIVTEARNTRNCTCGIFSMMKVDERKALNGKITQHKQWSNVENLPCGHKLSELLMVTVVMALPMKAKAQNIYNTVVV